MWSDKQHDQVVKALAVVCEVTGTTVSPAAATMMVAQLGEYPHDGVLRALERCARECKYRLSLADVIERIDDGRPGVEEAWAAFPKTEDEAGVVTREMLTAWGAARRAYADGDKVGARMAFKEAYERALRQARDEGQPAYWQITAGWDRMETEAAAIEAMRRGLVPPTQALALVEPERHDAALKAAGLPGLPQLEGPRDTEGMRLLAEAVGEIAAKKGAK